MCGIFGIVTRLSEQDVSGAVARATAALEHRGPDDTGIEFVSSGEVTAAFGHTRLAIIDLSAAGHQPMRDEGTGNWITFNGEVFNFRDLQSELAGQGVQFRSNSDTEVLLKGYRLRGRKAIDTWRGMFALGIWEQGSRRLTLVRDRLGIKPLYYYFDGQSFIFASEVRAILQTGLVPRRLCRAAVDTYLSYGSVQQPLTIVEDIRQLLPGHTLTLEDWQVTTEPYWELHAGAAESSADVSGEMRQLLEEAVRLRLVSDVPVGVFLSGGIDSSAVVALLRRASADRIKSFSVCFQEEEFSERIYAEQVARHFETEHTSVVVTGDEVLGKLPAALAAMDQPSIDGVNTYIVSEAVANAGLKVAISGLGGDEVFAGYGFFRNIARDERRRAQANRVPAGLRRAVGAAIGAVSTSNRVTKIGGLLSESEFDGHAVMSHRRLFTAGQRRRLLAANGLRGNASADESTVRSWTMRQLANCEHADAINQASMLDLGGYLANTLLRDTDTMSMAHSLEVRVPLIDHLVVERALKIPGDLKLREGRPKWLLIEAAGELPHEIVGRPKKGFELPFKHWLLGSLRERVSSALASPAIEGLFKPGSASEVWEEFEVGRVSWARVWSLFVLDEWTRQNL
jgi:asparagine synthase (glutamine-hydrolysing)